MLFRSHLGHARLYAANSIYNLGRVMEYQAFVWYRQSRLEEAKSEALRAADIFEKLGAVDRVDSCRKLMQDMQEELDCPAPSGRPIFDIRL